MFQNLGVEFLQIGSLLILIGVSLGIMVAFPRVPRQQWGLRFAMGLLLGGAIGNPLDRILHQGYVVDFISVGSLPIFNLADISILSGVVCLALIRTRNFPDTGGLS